MPFRERVVEYFRLLQDTICNALQEMDGVAKFREDKWERAEGGGGITRVIGNGKIFEKGGVNFSEVHGPLPEILRDQVNKEASAFLATGVSLVIHPLNPFVPIVHMNVRYFETDKGDQWFGGGIDLTPIYVNENDARNFHQELKKTCDTHQPGYYPEFKKWADDYFFIRHRNETRGIGGIFFDHLRPGDRSAEELFSFVKAVGNAFIPAYLPVVRVNRDQGYSAENLEWQRIRRGRYAEFNLVYDRGTKFGLETGGRVESILMSLPPLASWKYDHIPPAGSPEAKTLEYLRKGINWPEVV